MFPFLLWLCLTVSLFVYFLEWYMPISPLCPAEGCAEFTLDSEFPQSTQAMKKGPCGELLTSAKALSCRITTCYATKKSKWVPVATGCCWKVKEDGSAGNHKWDHLVPAGKSMPENNFHKRVRKDVGEKRQLEGSWTVRCIHWVECVYKISFLIQ